MSMIMLKIYTTVSKNYKTTIELPLKNSCHWRCHWRCHWHRCSFVVSARCLSSSRRPEVRAHFGTGGLQKGYISTTWNLGENNSLFRWAYTVISNFIFPEWTKNSRFSSDAWYVLPFFVSCLPRLCFFRDNWFSKVNFCHMIAVALALPVRHVIRKSGTRWYWKWPFHFPYTVPLR